MSSKNSIALPTISTACPIAPKRASIGPIIELVIPLTNPINLPINAPTILSAAQVGTLIQRSTIPLSALKTNLKRLLIILLK